jgi:hypothetical protein
VLICISCSGWESSFNWIILKQTKKLKCIIVVFLLKLFFRWKTRVGKSTKPLQCCKCAKTEIISIRFQLPVPLDKNSQTTAGVKNLTTSKTMFGWLTKKGPSIVVRWSWRFEPTFSEARTRGIYENFIINQNAENIFLYIFVKSCIILAVYVGISGLKMKY